MSNRSYSYWPMPQPQQCQIRAASTTYTTAHETPNPLPLSEARDQTCNLMVPNQIRSCCTMTGTPRQWSFLLYSKVIQLYLYTHLFSFRIFFHIDYQRLLVGFSVLYSRSQWPIIPHISVWVLSCINWKTISVRRKSKAQFPLKSLKNLW